MVVIGINTKHSQNVDQQRKRIDKMFLLKKGMVKTKPDLKLWSFPLYFCLYISRKWPLQRKHCIGLQS